MLINYDGHSMPILKGVEKTIYKKGQNFIMLVIGLPQTGKSTSVMQMIYEWAFNMGHDPEFELTKRASMGDPKEFIKISRLELKRGNILLMEEGGKGMDSQMWFDKVQKELKWIMQTFGHEGLFVIITSTQKDINNKITPLLRGELEMKDLDKSKGIAVGIFRIPQYNQEKRKVTHHKLARIRFPNGIIKPLKWITFKKPPQHIIDEYMNWSVPEKIKIKDEVYDNIQKREEEKKRKEEKLGADDIAEIIMKNPKKFVRIWRGIKLWNWRKIMGKFNVGQHTANKVIGKLPEPEEIK